MSDQEKFTQEDFAAMLSQHSSDILSTPTLEHAARVVTAQFTDEDWEKWHNSSGGPFSYAWAQWCGDPAGYVRVINIADDHLPQSRRPPVLLYQTPHPNSEDGDIVSYTHYLTGEVVGYGRSGTAGSVIPEGCEYLGHVYGDERLVHGPD